MLRGKTRGHHLFVEGECDVCAVILVIGIRSTFGLHRLETGRATLAHASAGADKTLVIQDGDAALPTGAITVPFVDEARSRATPDLERERETRGQLGRYTQQQFQNSGDPQQPSHPTLEQAILPFRHWQVLQSSSHLAPSGITLPMVMQDLPETERQRRVSGRTFLFS